MRVPDELKWAENLAEKKSLVLYVPAKIIDRIESVVYGPDEPMSFGANPPTCFLLKTVTGHTFIAKPENFIPLTEEQAQFYLFIVGRFNEATTEVSQAAARMNMPFETACVLMTSAFTMQSMVLETTRHEYQIAQS